MGWWPPVRRSVTVLGVGVLALTVAVTGLAGSAQAAANDTGDTYSWSLSPAPGGDGKAGNAGTVSAAQIWAACGLRDKNTKIVRTFTRVKASAGGNYIPGGTSNLACGSAAWGYRHIVKNHLSQWQSDAAIARENWRDLADFSIAAALSDPDAVSYRQSNDTFCYSRLIYLVDNRTGKVIDTRKPITVVARVTKNIITAYPSKTGC